MFSITIAEVEFCITVLCNLLKLILFYFFIILQKYIGSGKYNAKWLVFLILFLF